MARHASTPTQRLRPAAFAGSGRAQLDAWFASKGWEPWPFQRDAWDAFARGASGIIRVATGAGKTYAGYGGPLAALIDAPTRAPGPRVLYITPLRAVARDIEQALRAPIADMGLPLRVESRTGDTSSSVKLRQAQRWPDVLVTTPESLTLLLTREDAPTLFAGVLGVIVDEWHELLPTKRGTQTELALARLRAFSPGVRAWGLSATLPNLDDAARALSGSAAEPVLVLGDMPRPVQIDSVLPGPGTRLPWAGHLGLSMLPEVVAALDPAQPSIIFTNTRSQAERWFHAILVLRPQWEPVMALHHGSIDRDERTRVEAGLKSGEVRLVVATSSLDLGVDFAPIERVFQIGSPKGVGRLVQRAGRSGHRPRAACRVTCVPTHMLELVEIAAARQAQADGEVEARSAIHAPIDVLVQHLVTCALGGGFDPDAMYREVRSAWSYRDLPRADFDAAMQIVTQGGEALQAYPDYRRVVPAEGRMRVPDVRLARRHRMNVGTITSEATLEIRMVSGRSLGRIEEDFIAGLREGQRFVFAGRVLRFEGLRDDAALARPARGTTNHTPIWSGTKLPISETLAGAIRRMLARAHDSPMDCPELLAAQPLIDVQRRESAIPGPDEVLAELTHTREGSHLFLFPFEGRLVHAGLGSVLAQRFARVRPASIAVAVNDYGLELRSDDEFPWESALGPSLFSLEGLEADAAEGANAGLLARLQFREVARVSGLVQSGPGGARSGRHLHANSSLIFDVLSEFEPRSPLLAQSAREVMQRHFELGRLARTMRRLAQGPLRIVRTRGPTPLSLPLLVERAAGLLSSETLLDRIERLQHQWERPPDQPVTWEALPAPRSAPPPRRRTSGSRSHRPPLC